MRKLGRKTGLNQQRTRVGIPFITELEDQEKDHGIYYFMTYQRTGRRGSSNEVERTRSSFKVQVKKQFKYQSVKATIKLKENAEKRYLNGDFRTPCRSAYFK